MSALEWLGKAKLGVDMISICVEAIETIADVIKHVANSDQKVKLVGDVVDNVRAGWRGELSPTIIRGEFAKMTAGAKAADAAADAAADKKFGPKT